MNLKNISFAYDNNTVFSSFSVEFPQNKITAILGASGCGKTTLLRIIGEESKYCGVIEDKPNSIGYILQEPLLLPHFTVEKNIDFFLKSAISDKNKRKYIIESILKDVELYEQKEVYPSKLSGGMAQRVSLARAFSCPSDLLLMDEPFKGLDISLKKRILSIFLRLYDKSKKTVIFVTHDIDEAISISDKIIVLGKNEIKLEINLPPRKNKSFIDYPDIKKEIYDKL